MKKMLLALLGASLLACGSMAGAEDADVRIIVNGEELSFSGQKPVIRNDSVLIPFRSLFESLGAFVDWIPESRTILGSRDLNIIELFPQEAEAIVNGEVRELSAPVQIFEDTTMLPLRSVSELLDAKVDWEDETRTVTVTTEQVGEHVISSKTLTGSYENADGKTLMRVASVYPVLVGEEYDAVNQRSEEEASKFLDRALTSLKDAAEKGYQEGADEESFVPFYVLKNYEVTYDQFGMLSYVENGSEISNGSFYMDARNFHTEDATDLSWNEIVNLNEEESASLAPYTFYLYGNELYFILNSDNSIYAQMYQMPSALAVPEDCYKIDLATGEEISRTPEETENPDEQPSSGVVETKQIKDYTNAGALDRDLGFSMKELKDQARNVLVSRRMINEEIGEATYNRDENSNTVVVRAAIGDFDPSGIADSEKLEEYIYHGSMVELRKTQKLLYVTFAVETEQDVYSYSISLDVLDGKYALRQFAQEIIDQLV